MNVAIAEDQPPIKSGACRSVRHPAYTGAPTAFLGIALCVGTAAGLLVVVLGTFGAFSWRIHVGEHVLAQAFGQRWREYAGHNKRLIPGIYRVALFGATFKLFQRLNPRSPVFASK